MSPLDLAAYTVTAGAVLSAVGYIITKVRKAARSLDAIEDLVNLLPDMQAIVARELEHNHGSSMKDDMHGVAVSVGKLQRRQDDLERRFERHLTTRKETP